MNNKYLLLRHGQTIYQTEKKDILYPFPEEPPVDLTEKGESQIREAAGKLKEEKIDLIFTSDFFRTRKTAMMVVRECGLPENRIILDRRLRDLKTGYFQSGRKEDYQKFFSSADEKFEKRPPAGENWNDIISRVADFLNEVEKKYKNKNILVVSHGDPLWFLAMIIRGFKAREEFLSEKGRSFYQDVGQLIIPR